MHFMHYRNWDYEYVYNGIYRVCRVCGVRQLWLNIIKEWSEKITREDWEDRVRTVNEVKNRIKEDIIESKADLKLRGS